MPIPRVTARICEELPGPWWDEICLRAQSSWNSLRMQALQGQAGVECRRVVAERDGRPVGVLSVFLAGARRFKVADPVVGRAGSVKAAPAVCDGPPETTAVLVSAAHELLSRSGAVSATWRLEMPDPPAAAELRSLGYSLRPYGVGLFDLPDSAAGLESAIHSKSRNLVRKALKSGVTIEVEPGVDNLLPLLDASFRRSGLEPRDADYVRRAHAQLGAEVLVARRSGVPLAALLWQPFGSLGLYLFHGRSDGDTVGASNLLLLEMFRRGHARGVRCFHAGDVALAAERDERLLGITHFKERMGFRVVETCEATLTMQPVRRAVRDSALKAWLGLRGERSRVP